MEEVIILEPMLIHQPLIRMEDLLEMMEHQQQILRQQELEKPKEQRQQLLPSCEHVEDQYQV